MQATPPTLAKYNINSYAIFNLLIKKKILFILFMAFLDLVAHNEKHFPQRRKQKSETDE